MGEKARRRDTGSFFWNLPLKECPLANLRNLHAPQIGKPVAVVASLRSQAVMALTLGAEFLPSTGTQGKWANVRPRGHICRQCLVCFDQQSRPLFQCGIFMSVGGATVQPLSVVSGHSEWAPLLPCVLGPAGWASGLIHLRSGPHSPSPSASSTSYGSSPGSCPPPPRRKLTRVT